MSSDLASWAEDVQKEVFNFWHSNYSNWDPGFQVWYGPVDKSKSVLILGLQPAGDEGDFANDRERFEQGDFSLPEEHDYRTSDFDLARDTRKAVPDKLIQQSVKTNINFFRAYNDSDWRSNLNKESREEIEEFSYARVDELINRLKPEVIITEGIRVYNKLQSDWDFEEERVKKHPVGEKKQERLYCIGRSDRFDIVGLKHPSAGFGISSENYNEMKKVVTAVWNGNV